MPVTPTYPGVYVQEIPSGVRTITGVPTSVAAFVDFFAKGPVNEAVRVYSWADVERTFGGLHSRSEASYALDHFFRNGGGEAWVVRVTNANTPAVVATAVARTAPVGGAAAATFQAASPGAWGNQVRVRVDPLPDAARFNVVAREVRVADGREVVLSEVAYTNLTMAAGDPNNIATVINAAAEDRTGLLRAIGAGAIPPESSGFLGTAIPAPLPAALTNNAAKPLTVTLRGPGAFVDDQRQIDLGTAPVTSLEDAAARLQAALVSAQPAVAAVPAGRVEYLAAYVRVVGTRLHIVPGVGAEPFVRFEFGGATAGPLGLNVAANSNIAAYRLGAVVGSRAQNASTAGVDGALPAGADLVGTEAVNPPTGMFALNLADNVNLVCLPRIAKVAPANGGDAFNQAQVDFTVSSFLNYCMRRRAVLLLDPPDDAITPAQIRQWITDKAGLRDNSIALYYPRLIVGDPLNGFRDRSFGPSGAVAGICARTDTSRGVWKAPAGTEAVLRGVTRLQTRLTDAENGTINPIAVNALRTFDLYGPVVWGARTLHGENARGSEWQYLPVRRLANFIEETLFRSTQWVIFEPNDEPLWAQIRLAVGAFMNDLFRKGAFQGLTKRDAYFVRCDSTTTTPFDQARGIVNLVVGFAPLRPAEFLIITIQQIPPRLED